MLLFNFVLGYSIFKFILWFGIDGFSFVYLSFFVFLFVCLYDDAKFGGTWLPGVCMLLDEQFDILSKSW